MMKGQLFELNGKPTSVKNGQSLWINDHSRQLLNNGFLYSCIEELSVTGLQVTAASLSHGLLGGTDYDLIISKWLSRGMHGQRLAWSLVEDETCHAADQLRQVHERTDGVDGWAVLPRSPLTQGSKAAVLDDIRVVYEKINRPNILINISGSHIDKGLIEALIIGGYPLLIDALFSSGQCASVVASCLRGVERRIIDGVKPAVPVFLSISILKLASSLAANMGWQKGLAKAIAAAKQISQGLHSAMESPSWRAARNCGARQPKVVWSLSPENKSLDRALDLTNRLLTPCTVLALSGPTIHHLAETGAASGLGDQQTAPFNEGELDEVSTAEIEALARELQLRYMKNAVNSWLMMLEIVAKKSAQIAQSRNFIKMQTNV
jgi:hypothetical protein